MRWRCPCLAAQGRTGPRPARGAQAAGPVEVQNVTTFGAAAAGTTEGEFRCNVMNCVTQRLPPLSLSPHLLLSSSSLETPRTQGFDDLSHQA
mmetsp:Transcript_30629/g.89007  ORF Transcript_30629/g.89007 Transcript_30629/m.89007 type:complete len:92 (-) Transcript_30629:74-349(-)